MIFYIIGKQYIVIYYELIPQIKHIMPFYIAQGIITDIIHTFFNLVPFTIQQCYSVLLCMYFQLHFFFLRYTTVLLIIHVGSVHAFCEIVFHNNNNYYYC